MPDKSRPHPDTVKAIRRAARSGHPESCVAMGDFHSDGRDILPEDHRRALRYYRRAAAAGNAAGQQKAAGMIWELAKLDPESRLAAIEEATVLLRKAATQGNDVARVQLVSFWNILSDRLKTNRRQASVSAHTVWILRGAATSRRIFSVFSMCWTLRSRQRTPALCRRLFDKIVTKKSAASVHRC